MDNYHITEADLTTYLLDSNTIEITEKVELWMNSDERNNISLTEIIEMIWKIIV